ncbi:hypothetical protein ACFL2I_01785 [Candidatus Omnitrophota bacterium]
MKKNTFFLIIIFSLCVSPVFAAQTATIVLTVTPNAVPQILQVQPPDGSAGYTADNISFVVNAQDANGDSMLYQFSVDEQVIAPWQGSPEFDWSTEEVGWGVHTIKIEVRDIHQANDSYSANLCLFIKPPALP